MVKDSKKSSFAAAKVFGGVPPPIGCSGKGKGTPISSCDIKKMMILGGAPHLRCAGKGTRSRKEIKKKKDIEMKENDEIPPLHLYEVGRKMILPEDSKILYATNLNHPINRMLVEADIVEFFRDVGKVVRVEIQLVPKCPSLIDFAKIEFESHDVAKKAMEMKARRYLFQTPIQLDGFPESEVPCYNMTDCTNERHIISCFGFGKVGFGQAISLCKLQSELEKFFSSLGEVKVRVPLHDDGTSFGYSYIEFKNEKSLQKAFELDGKSFLDSTLHVRRATVFVTSC